MDLTSNKIPNKMLSGTEMMEIACKEFRQMLERDWHFSNKVAFRKAAFTLTGVFHFGYPYPVDVEIKSRVQAEGLVEGEAPLKDDSESEVVGLERDVQIDNPNLARVHHDIPIVVTERQMPKPQTPDVQIPGETPTALLNPFPEMVKTELKYDKTQFPKGPESVDRDVTEKAAKQIGAKARNRS